MSDARLEVFEAQRPRLFGIAYRMLGSAAEADDMVQNAWLRWQGADRDAVAEPAAFLTTVVTRLCLNELDSAWQGFVINADRFSQSFVFDNEGRFPPSPTSPFNFDDTLTAGTVALYNAACLLLQSVFLILALSKPPSFLYTLSDQRQPQCAAIDGQRIVLSCSSRCRSESS